MQSSLHPGGGSDSLSGAAVIHDTLGIAVRLGVALIWLRALASRRYVVSGDSMLPTLRPGDRLLVNSLLHRWRDYTRGEIVVLRDPEQPRLESAKRLIGLPGERVTLVDGQLSVEGRRVAEPYLQQPGQSPERYDWLLRSDEYLVMGDNRVSSRDSRHFGPVPARLLIGPAWYRYWPAGARGFVGWR
jgi:signal peptidase I